MGLKTAAEIFADRAYMEDLSLVPWKQSVQSSYHA